MVTRSPAEPSLLDRFVPHGCLMAVSPIKVNRTAGGLILPDNMKESTVTVLATVLRIGPDVKQYKPGDTVLFHTATRGMKAELGPSECDRFMVVEEDKVLGKLLEEGAAE